MCCSQVQEQLDSLALQATTNAMYVVKGEKHVFTNNGSYMKTLDKMKKYVMDQKQRNQVAGLQATRSGLGSPAATKDEVDFYYCKAASACAPGYASACCMH